MAFYSDVQQSLIIAIYNTLHIDIKNIKFNREVSFYYIYDQTIDTSDSNSGKIRVTLQKIGDIKLSMILNLNNIPNIETTEIRLNVSSYKEKSGEIYPDISINGFGDSEEKELDKIYVEIDILEKILDGFRYVSVSDKVYISCKNTHSPTHSPKYRKIPYKLMPFVNRNELSFYHSIIKPSPQAYNIRAILKDKNELLENICDINLVNLQKCLNILKNTDTSKFEDTNINKKYILPALGSIDIYSRTNPNIVNNDSKLLNIIASILFDDITNRTDKKGQRQTINSVSLYGGKNKVTEKEREKAKKQKEKEREKAKKQKEKEREKAKKQKEKARAK